MTYICIQKEQNYNKKFQSLIDILDELIIIKSSKKTYSINKTFLDFLGLKNLNAFTKKYNDINNNLLLRNKNLNIDLNNIDESTIETLNNLDQSSRFVKIVDKDGQTKTLTIKISKFNGTDTLYALIFSDITKLQTQSNKFEKQANTDSLTGICSREKFNELYNAEFNRSLRYFNHLTILFIDIDYFKNINDKYGHDIGDETLKTFTQIISENIRKYDIFARWGGEEFILMLPQTDINSAYKLSEKIRKAIQKNKFDKINSLTCSIGVSMLHKGDEAETLIKRSDIALYKAKKSGRNRTIMEI